MTAIDNNNPDVYWLTGGQVNPLTVGNELWQVAMQATSWGTTTIDLKTAPVVGGTFTTAHTFTANGAPFVFRPGPCRMEFILNGTSPPGIRQTISRIPEADTSDTITFSITGGGTGLSVAAPIDGGGYQIAGTSDVATNLVLRITPFEDSIAGLPTALIPIASGVVGAFSFDFIDLPDGLRLPKCSSVQVQAVNTAANVSGTITKMIGDNRRSKSNTLRNVPGAAGNPINFNDDLFMFLADTAGAWTTQTVGLEADFGSGFAAIATLDNSRAPKVFGVVSASGVKVPFRFHPSATIPSLVCAYAQIPMDAVDDAPSDTLNTASGLSFTGDTVGGAYDISVFVNSNALIGQNFSSTSNTNAPGANKLFLRQFVAPATGTLKSLSCLPAATSGTAKFKAVVYPDNAGSPNGQSLLGTGAEVVGATSGTELKSTFAAGPTLTAGQTYWCGFITNASVLLTEVDVNLIGVSAANTYTSGAPATCPTVTTGLAEWEVWGTIDTGNTDVVINWSPEGAVAGSNLTVPLASFLGGNSSGGATGHGDYSATVQLPPGQFYVTSSNGNTTVNVGGSRTQGD